MKSGGQVQIGMWFLVAHWALKPQVLGQGSEHLLFMQARWIGHSLLTRHSGRQAGGFPIKLGKHVQTGCWLTVLHLLFGPQGVGEHGSLGTITKKIFMCY